jgi:quaternary ammonium compound-resistance protein SugE
MTSAALTAWTALLLAGACEIVWAFALKQTDGLTQFWPAATAAAAILASYALMGISLKEIPFGTAYAIWAGIGVAGSAGVGIMALGEPADAARLLCLALITAGIVGLESVGSG